MADDSKHHTWNGGQSIVVSETKGKQRQYMQDCSDCPLVAKDYRGPSTQLARQEPKPAAHLVNYESVYLRAQGDTQTL